jgi:AraC family transcriptional regulator of adaptative response/methylated-DNA-[protein]-cysteine methyltransferase
MDMTPEAAMLSPDRLPDLCILMRANHDYAVVRRAIAYISERWRAQPEIEQIAHAVGVTPDELHHLFRRWAGLTPKAFLQAITLDNARKLLRDSASVLDATYEVGLSGPGRLHDLFVTHEAMSPGEWKSGGEGLTISYGFHPFAVRHRAGDGDAARPAGLAFGDPGEEKAMLADMRGRWVKAAYVEDKSITAPLAARIFDAKLWRPDRPLRIIMIGTDFEVRVWETLLGIPMGKCSTYSDIASKIGRPKASRAVGARSAKPDVVRGAVPPRARPLRRHHGLSLGADTQARDARLGSGAGGGVGAGCHPGRAKREPGSVRQRSRT